MSWNPFKRKGTTKTSRPRIYRPRLEILEDRCVPSINAVVPDYAPLSPVNDANVYNVPINDAGGPDVKSISIFGNFFVPSSDSVAVNGQACGANQVELNYGVLVSIGGGPPANFDEFVVTPAPNPLVWGSNEVTVTEPNIFEPKNPFVYNDLLTLNPVAPTVNQATTIENPPQPLVGQSFTLTVNGSFSSEAQIALLYPPGDKTAKFSINSLFSYNPQMLTLNVTSAVAGIGNGVVLEPGGEVQEPGSFNGPFSASGPFYFTVYNPQPTLDSAVPLLQSGDSAFTFTLTGKNFVAGCSVYWTADGTNFHLVPAANITDVVRDTSLKATLPLGDLQQSGQLLSNIQLQVVNPGPALSGGASNLSTPVSLSLPAPSIADLNPVAVQAGSTGNTLHIDGSGLSAVDQVLWNGTPLNTQLALIAGGEVSIPIPNSDLAAPGTATITVVDPEDNKDSNTATFTIGDPTTGLTGINPTSVSLPDPPINSNWNNRLQVSGVNFPLNAQVYWDKQALPTDWFSSTLVIATVPTNLTTAAGTHSITVQSTAADGSVTIDGPLTFAVDNPQPIIDSASAALPGQDSTITVKDTETSGSYVPGATVIVDGTECQTTFVSPNELTAVVPGDLIPAPTVDDFGFIVSKGVPLTVDNPEPNAGESSPAGNMPAPTFWVTDPAPTIASVSPNTAVVGSGDVNLTITGTGFVPGLTNFQLTGSSFYDEEPYTATVQSYTLMTVTIPASDVFYGSANSISVYNDGIPGGGQSNSVPFLVTNPQPEVTDLSQNFTPAGSGPLQVTLTGSGFGSWSNVTWSNAAGYAYVSSFTNTQLVVNVGGLTTPGDASIQVSSSGSLNGVAPNTLSGLANPNALAFDAGGDLFVANAGNGTVSEFAPGSTTPTATLTGLSDPLALTFDGHGNLFVANGGNGTVSEFTAGSTTPTATLSGLSQPDALAFDAHGDLFVANDGNGTVSEFAPGGTTSTATLTGLSGPAALLFDGNGNLFVANGSGTTVSEFAPGNTTATATLTGLSDPVALAFDRSGDLYVANAGTGWVSSFEPGSTTPNAGVLSGPSKPDALVYYQGMLYVADAAGSVLEYPYLQSSPSSTLPGLSDPVALAFDGQGNLFVANYGFGAGATVTEFPTTASQSNPVTFVVGNPLPTITSMAPQGPFPFDYNAGSNDTTFTVTGTGFLDGATVEWNGQDRTTTFLSSTQLTVVITAVDLANVGTAQIVIVNGDGQDSAAQAFDVTPWYPTLNTMSPSSAPPGTPGLQLTVTGEFFNAASVVQWNGVNLPTTYVSGQMVTATLSAQDLAQVTTSQVTVYNGKFLVFDLFSNADFFTVQYPPPTIVSIDPSTIPAGSVPANGQLLVTVTGTNFQNTGESVVWNSADYPATFESSTQLQVLLPGSLIANPGSASVQVSDNQDGLSNTVSYTIGPAPAGGSVLFNQASLVVPASMGSATITVIRTGPVNQPVAVDYATSDGTAKAGVNYTATSGTLSFAAGQTSKTFSVPIRDDGRYGGGGTVNLSLSNPTNGAALGLPASAVLTISNTDPQPTVSFKQASGSGPESQSPSLLVVLSAASALPTTVAFAAGGTAVAGTDYTLPAGNTLTFNPGQTSLPLPITLLDDGTMHPNLTLQVTLSSPTNANLGKITAETYTIIDNNPLPAVAFAKTGSSGPEPAKVKVPVVLSAKSVAPVTVNYAVTGGTATAGVDFNLAPGTLTIPPGKTNGTITLPILDDKLYEPSVETIVVTLSGPGNAVLGSASVFTFTITETDPLPTVSFKLSKGSGKESQTPNLLVVLSGGSSLLTTVSYAVMGGTAVAGTDYTLPAVTTLTFQPGQTSLAIPLTLINDGTVHPNRTLKLQLASPTNAGLGKKKVEVFTIIDDNPK